ncbi:transmembrane protein, partial [Cystoisospora suis]
MKELPSYLPRQHLQKVKKARRRRSTQTHSSSSCNSTPPSQSLSETSRGTSSSSTSLSPSSSSSQPPSPLCEEEDEEEEKEEEEAIHWDFVVGHLLGVDHVGHKAEVQSSLMTAKLQQMNLLITQVIRYLLYQKTLEGKASTKRNQRQEETKVKDLSSVTPPSSSSSPSSPSPSSSSSSPSSSSSSFRSIDRTWLMIGGDHGMTDDGAHGGALSEEVDAALFVFSFLPLAFSSSDVKTQLLSSSSSSLPLFSSPLPGYIRHHAALLSDIENRLSSLKSSSSSSPVALYPRRIHQVDWTPTVALLLGLPIPFSSLGSIILDLIPSLSSFVPICKTLTQSSSSSSPSLPSSSSSFSLSSHSSSSSSVSLSLSYRCNDLLYATQLQHIAAWHKRRSIDVYAKTSKSYAVVEDQTVKKTWTDVLEAFQKFTSLRAQLPLSFHEPLNLHDEEKEIKKAEERREEEEEEKENKKESVPHHEEERTMNAPFPRSKEAHEKPLFSSSVAAPSSLDVRDVVEEILKVSRIYLSACTEFSQAVFNASKRQFSTFDETYIFLGILLAIFTSFLLLSVYFFFLHLLHLDEKEEKAKEEEEGERKKMLKKREEEEEDKRKEECETLRGEGLLTMVANNIEGEEEEEEKKKKEKEEDEREEDEEVEGRRRRWQNSDKNKDNSGEEEREKVKRLKKKECSSWLGPSCKREEMKRGACLSENRNSFPSSSLRQREAYISSFFVNVWSRFAVKGYSRYGVGTLLCIFLFSDCYCMREHAAGRFLLSLGLLIAFAI